MVFYYLKSQSIIYTPVQLALSDVVDKIRLELVTISICLSTYRFVFVF